MRHPDSRLCSKHITRGLHKFGLDMYATKLAVLYNRVAEKKRLQESEREEDCAEQKKIDKEVVRNVTIMTTNEPYYVRRSS